MSTGGKIAIAITSIIVIILIICGVFFGLTPAGKATWNNWFHAVQKADDATNYKTLKEVEDTCRAMISSYTSDKLTYEQYKDSDNEEKQSWAEQAKMRANKTASTYNNYVLKNQYVWKDNVPFDIYMNLPYIENEPVVKENHICPECGNSLDKSDYCYLTYPAKYDWTCSKCGYKETKPE